MCSCPSRLCEIETDDTQRLSTVYTIIGMDVLHLALVTLVLGSFSSLVCERLSRSRKLKGAGSHSSNYIKYTKYLG
jgi:hypothetical protein